MTGRIERRCSLEFAPPIAIRAATTDATRNCRTVTDSELACRPPVLRTQPGVGNVAFSKDDR
jgi:hypothetical protein